MAWTAPATAVANSTLTAAFWNQQVRDNELESPAAKATTPGGFFVTSGVNSVAERIPQQAFVAAAETTTSATYTNLTTSGPTVTVTTGATALVLIHCRESNSSAGANVWASWEVTGATPTVGASDNYALSYDSPVAGSTAYHGLAALHSGLTVGSNSFTMKYRASSGTGSFSTRRIVVVPF